MLSIFSVQNLHTFLRRKNLRPPPPPPPSRPPPPPGRGPEPGRPPPPGREPPPMRGPEEERSPAGRSGRSPAGRSGRSLGVDAGVESGFVVSSAITLFISASAASPPAVGAHRALVRAGKKPRAQMLLKRVTPLP